MASGLEPAIARAVTPIVRQAAGRLREERKLRRVRDEGRPLMAKSTADALVDELPPYAAAQVARYLTSPDFEHVALQLVTVRPGSREEDLSAVREQLRQGLRHATTLTPDSLLGITDLVLAALIAAVPSPSSGEHADLLVNRAHITAMGARNGELLAGLDTLATCHTEAREFREQVAALHAALRVPHTGVQRSVPWDRLYVAPGLVRQGHRDDGGSPVRDLLEAGRRIVVLGDPGAGKSTLAEKLAYDLACRPTGTEVPFLVVLRHFSAALQAGERTLAEHIAMSAREPHNVELSAETVEYLLLNGRAVVILDGFDELTDIGLRRRVAELVRGFVLRYPTVPVLVTSRRVGYTEAPLDDRLFETYGLAPFTTEQAETYARNWFAIDDSTPEPERTRLADSFLRESTSIQELRGNPLLLSLLCAMYSAEHYIPRLRSQIYERCALLVFERWDRMRGIGRPMEFEGRVRGAVQALAWELFTGADTELPRHRIVRILVRHLVERGFDEDDAEAVAREFLGYCAGRAWVLEEVGTTDLEPIYGFAHRTFMEYFAAEHLVRHHPTPAEAWHVLAEPVRAGKWEVVAQLTLQLIERNRADGAEELIRLALHSCSHSGGRTAEFCARALGHVTVSPPTAGRVTRLAWDHAMRLPPARRVRLAIDVADRELADTDWPLYELLYRCLDGNLAFVRRALAEVAADRLDDGDPLAFILVNGLTQGPLPDDEARRRVWQTFIEEQRIRHAARFADWQAEHPWAAPHDGRHIVATLERHGPMPFYLSSRVMMGNPFPLALAWFRPPADGSLEAARLLSRLLLDRPVPWMPLALWVNEFPVASGDPGAVSLDRLVAMIRPIRGEDLGAYLVLSLPYFEMIRLGRKPAVEFADVHVATDVLLGGDEQLPSMLAEREVPPPMADFLLRWAAKEFRVLG